MNARDMWKTPIDEDLLIAPQPIIGALAVVGLISVLVSDGDLDSKTRSACLLLAAFCYSFALMTILINQRHPRSARWLLCFLPVLVVVGGLSGLQNISFLALLPVPIVAAFLLVGPPAAITVTTALSSYLVLVRYHHLDVHNLIILQAALWLSFLLMVVLYSFARRIANWSLHSTQQQQSLLEEARERGAGQEQILNELMHANRQLDLMNERLAATRLMAEEAHKAKSTFVAKVSHEFRTPLNMIIGLTDLLIETPDVYGDALPPELLEDLQIVHRNCLHLTSMINDVLAISQTEAGRLSLHREWVNIRAEIESAVTVVNPLVKKKGLALHVHVTDDLPDVYCDRTRIRQVILNLVSNAARYTEQGTIIVEATLSPPAVTVSVADTGPGIDPEDLKMIFEPFYQQADSMWRGQAGNGLGLAISRQFIELHDGRIWAESTPGSGSMFAFRLPISPSRPPAASTSRWINEEWMWLERSVRPEVPQLPYRQRIVLCDEIGDFSNLAHYPTEAVELVEVGDVEEAIAAIEECPAHALILNALSPEHMWAVMDDARRNLPDTPIFSYTLPHAVDRSLESGVLRYLIKPITRADLRAVLADTETPPARILLVDDDRDFRSLLARMLSTLDPSLEIFSAQNGEEALHLLHTQVLDLVFLDIVMPNYDGWHLLDYKNRDSAICDIPVVIVSAQDPVGQSMSKGILIATLGDGIPSGKLLPCVCSLAELLMRPESELDQRPVEAPLVEPA